MKFENFFLIIVTFISLTACKNPNKALGTNSEIVKHITTRAYYVTTNFNDETVEEPLYQFPPRVFGNEKDERTQWTIRYFDKHDNVVKEEGIRIDESGEEYITKTKYYFYQSPENHKISKVSISDNIWGDSEEEYIWDMHGNLSEIRNFKENQMVGIKVYKYNENSQITSLEIYEDNKLIERTEYTYNTHPEIGSYNSFKRFLSVESNYLRETEYALDNKGKIIMINSSYYQDGELFSQNITNVEEYNVGIAIKEKNDEINFKPTMTVTRGSDVENYGQGKSSSLIERKLDVNNNITKETSQKVTESGELMLTTEEWKYTYNEKDEWIKLIHTYDSVFPDSKFSLGSIKNNSYTLVVREIVYH